MDKKHAYVHATISQHRITVFTINSTNGAVKHVKKCMRVVSTENYRFIPRRTKCRGPPHRSILLQKAQIHRCTFSQIFCLFVFFFLFFFVVVFFCLFVFLLLLLFCFVCLFFCFFFLGGCVFFFCCCFLSLFFCLFVCLFVLYNQNLNLWRKHLKRNIICGVSHMIVSVFPRDKG